MAFKISGFGGTHAEKKQIASTYDPEHRKHTPRKSLVQVRFPGRGMALSYYNDEFDLKVGDRVYVDGKLEGQLGHIMDVSYNFKIKLSDYKKVIAVVDTEVHGQFFLAGSHFITFDPAVLPKEQITLWFKAPAQDDEEYVSNSDDTSFRLDDFKEFKVNPTIADRGHDYYIENRVRYISLNGHQGFAIVEGDKSYAIEFAYHNGEIRHLICDCPCSYNCKHEVATMLQLKETLELIDKHYAEEFERTGYFAAITKSTLFAFAVDGKETGSFTI